MSISKELENKLDKLAKKAGKPPSKFLNLLLDRYTQEEAEAKEADKLYNDFIKSGEKTIPLHEVIKRNGL